MPTRYTLTVNSDQGDSSGNGTFTNSTIATDNPDDLLSALRQLAGINTASNNYGATEVSSCGAMEEDQELANSPDVQVYPAGGGVGDLVPTGHSARVRNRYTKDGSGDNPLAEEDDEEQLDEFVDDRSGSNNHILVDKDSGEEIQLPATLNDFRGDEVEIVGFTPPKHAGSTGRVQTASGQEFYPDVVNAKIVSRGGVDNGELEESIAAMLMREWTETKLQSVSESFDRDAAVKAITEGKKEYVHATKKYAVRVNKNIAKVYPILENRALLTMPLLVVDKASLVRENEDYSQLDELSPDLLRRAGRKVKDQAADARMKMAAAGKSADDQELATDWDEKRADNFYAAAHKAKKRDVLNNPLATDHLSPAAKRKRQRDLEAELAEDSSDYDWPGKPDPESQQDLSGRDQAEFDDEDDAVGQDPLQKRLPHGFHVDDPALDGDDPEFGADDPSEFDSDEEGGEDYFPDPGMSDEERQEWADDEQDGRDWDDPDGLGDFVQEDDFLPENDEAFERMLRIAGLR